MHIFHKRNKIRKLVERITILTLIISWVFSPIIPTLPLPFTDKGIRLGMEVNKAHAAFANGYSFKRTITIDPTKVSGPSNLTDFPVLISLANASLATTGNGGSVTNANGYDIVFSTDSTGATTLDHEIERYTATGELAMWVRVPTLDTTSNTVIHMFYGSSTISTSQEAIAGTWDSGYKGVWHMNGNNTLQLDSASSTTRNDAAVTGATSGATGKIATAYDFNGTSNVLTVTDEAEVDITNTGTVEAWMRTDNLNTWESSPSAWQSIATTTLLGAGKNEFSNIDSVIVGETAYYGAMLCSGTSVVFRTASTSIVRGPFSSWVGGAATGTSANAGGGCALGVDSDGKEIWYVTLSSNGTLARAAYATSTLAAPTVSATTTWRALSNVSTPSLLENSSIDVVITGGRAYLAALAVNGAVEAFYTGSVKLDGSGWTGWTDQADPVGAGAGEGCSTSIDTDGVKLYYTSLCQSAGGEDYEVARSNLDGTGFIAWATGNNPAGTGADAYSFSDAAIVGGQTYHASFAHAAAVTDFNTASTTVEGGALTWIVKKTSSATVDPDGAAAGDTTDTMIETDGKNIYYGAFAHASTSASFFISSSTLPAHPFISKSNAYELMQTGKGYVFDWAGKPTTFSTTTAVSTFEHVVVTHDGTFMSYYKNGTLMGSTTVSTDFESNANNLLIGSGFRSVGTQIYFDGIIDEVRISSTARSSDWIATQYNNQNATSTFYTLGSEEPAESGEPLIYSTQNERFAIGQASTAISPINIREGASPSITASNNILIAISTTTGFTMEWDTTDTSATIGGSASGKVSGTVSYLGPTILSIDVTSSFAAFDTLTISGLSYRNFTAPGKSNTGALVLYAGATTGGTALATSTTLMTIGTTGRQQTRLSKPPNYLKITSDSTSYYPFDGGSTLQNISDISGQANSGRFVAGAGANTATTTAIGKIGQALDFDGTDDYITSSSDFISTGADTISVWMRPRSLGEGSTGRIVDNGQVRLYLSGSNTVSFSSDNGSTVANSASSVFSLNNGWTHVAVTRLSDGTANIYVNGSLSGSANQTSGTPTAGSAVHVGNNSATTATFDGLLDDFRTYGRALSAEEIGFLSRIGQAKANKVTPSGALADGLVGYWSFDGKTMYTNVADSSGQGNNGNLVVGGAGNTATTTVPGKIGQALNFDGGTDHVDLNNPSVLGLAQFSVAAWFKRRGTGVTVTTGSNGLTGTTLSEPIVAKLIGEADGTTQDGNYFLGIAPAVMKLTGDFEDSPIGSNHPIVGSTTLVNDVWYHGVYTYSGTGMALYLNGVQEGATLATTSAPRSNSIQEVGIGATLNSVGAAAGFWNGDIDEVRIYNRALSAAEIFRLFKSGQTTVKP